MSGPEDNEYLNNAAQAAMTRKAQNILLRLSGQVLLVYIVGQKNLDHLSLRFAQ